MKGSDNYMLSNISIITKCNFTEIALVNIFDEGVFGKKTDKIFFIDAIFFNQISTLYGFVDGLAHKYPSCIVFILNREFFFNNSYDFNGVSVNLKHPLEKIRNDLMSKVNCATPNNILLSSLKLMCEPIFLSKNKQKVVSDLKNGIAPYQISKNHDLSIKNVYRISRCLAKFYHQKNHERLSYFLRYLQG
jgi:hypothetical protein